MILKLGPNSDVAFFEKLEENIENVSTCTEKIIITGDVNCNMLTENNLSRKIVQVCKALYISQIVTRPTRIIP